ncbi:MAG: zf-HC2 domain-containing protein [Planctomycetota bacterium]|jgi:predicted anti-sigma-YlaC factor YlaD
MMEDTCETIQEQIPELLAGRLPIETATFIRAHMSQCPACSGYFEALQADDKLLSDFAEATRRAVSRIENKVIETLKAEVPCKPARSFRVWVNVAKGRVAKLAAAVVIIIAAVAGTPPFRGSIKLESVAFGDVGGSLFAGKTATLTSEHTAEHILVFALLAANLAVGFGGAVAVARFFQRRIFGSKSSTLSRYFTILVGIYIFECLIFAAGGLTPVTSVAMAFIWGIVFGFWFRTRTSVDEALRTSFFVSLYSSFPVASFYGFIPVAKLLSGKEILTAAGGAGSGIPVGFFPWPMNTVLGFFGSLSIATIVFKTVITTGQVSLLMHLAERPLKKTLIAGSVVVAVCASVIVFLQLFKPPGPPTLVITGVATDARTGQPVAGVKVWDDGYGPEPRWDVIADASGPQPPHFGAITDSHGRYEYLTWPEHHGIKAEAPGYESQRKSLYQGHLLHEFAEKEVIDFALKPE